MSGAPTAAETPRISLRLGPCPARILGSGVAFPPDAIGTGGLLLRLTPGLPSERREALLAHVATELGVATRAHLAPGADPLTLPADAARLALAEADVEVGALLCATSTPTRWTTAESARLARVLGLRVAFHDVRSGCTGGLWAFVEAARLARDSGRAVLVVGCDSFSRALPADERLLPLALGDGAAALVVGPGAESGAGLVSAVFGGLPEHVDLATVKAALPPTSPAQAFVLSGDPEPFARAAEAALFAAIDAIIATDECRALRAPAAGAGTAAPLEESKKRFTIVPHVGRIATAHRIAARFGRPVFSAGFVAHGNLGAASLLTALHLIRASDDPIRPLLLASAGGGLSFGAALWHSPSHSEIIGDRA